MALMRGRVTEPSLRNALFCMRKDKAYLSLEQKFIYCQGDSVRVSKPFARLGHCSYP